MTVTAPQIHVGLIPQRRLGRMLRERRETFGYSVEDMARRSRARFSAAQIVELESGNYPLDDMSVEALSLLYEFNSSPATPQRSRLIVDPDEYFPGAGEAMDEYSIDRLLCRYMGLLYIMRQRPVGEALPLREKDLSAIGEAFGVSDEHVQDRLQTLMATHVGLITDYADRLRRRLSIPAAGLLVGPTPVGVLILVK